MNEITHAYTAGIIDGEGSITLTKSAKARKFRFPFVTVASTTHCLLEFLQSEYGGFIVKHKTYKKHHKPSWMWSVQSNKALKMLELVKPYLKVPEKQKKSTFATRRI